MKQEVKGDDSSNNVKLIERLEVKREERENFMQENFMKVENSNLHNDFRSKKGKSNSHAEKDRNDGSSAVVTSEEFKRFMLQCYWQKRVSRNEVNHLNLQHIVSIFRQAFE